MYGPDGYISFKSLNTTPVYSNEHQIIPLELRGKELLDILVISRTNISFGKFGISHHKTTQSLSKDQLLNPVIICRAKQWYVPKDFGKAENWQT